MTNTIEQSPNEPRRVATRELLEESFIIMAQEVPRAWKRFCGCLDGCVVELTLDAQQFCVRFSADVVRIEIGLQADAQVQTTRETVLDVLDAELSLHEAVMLDKVHVKASPAMIVQLYSAITAYVHGGVRSPSFPSLLSRYRKMADDQGISK